MKHFGIELKDRIYNKDEVESLLHQVVDGMLNEELVRLQYNIDHPEDIEKPDDFLNKELNLLERSIEENDTCNIIA